MIKFGREFLLVRLAFNQMCTQNKMASKDFAICSKAAGKLKFSKFWKTELQALAKELNEVVGMHFPTRTKPFVGYHPKELVDFTLCLDWKYLRLQYREERAKFNSDLESTLTMIPLTIVKQIAEFAEPLWEGSWYTSGEVFLRFFNERQFVGVFGVLYVLIGEICEENLIQFHQYPIQQNEFTDVKVTLFGKIDSSNRRISSKFAHGLMDTDFCVRGPTLVRDAGPRIMLNCAATNDIEGLAKCLRQGIDINVSSKEVQSSTPLMMAAVSGHVEAVKFLLENRANPLMERPNGISALTYAQQRSYAEIVGLLNAEICRLGGNKTTDEEFEDTSDYSDEIMFLATNG